MPSLIATLGANISEFVRNLDQAKTHAKKGGEEIGSAFGSELSGRLKGLAVGIGIEETIRRTIEYGSKVNDLSLRLGISTDAVQQWDFALKQSGSSIDAAAPFFEKLAASRDKALKGNPEMIEGYRKLGLSVSQLGGMRTEDIGLAISKAYEAGDPQELIASLRAVGGRGAGELAAAFSEGLAGKLDEALVINPEDIANLDAADDALKNLSATMRAMFAGPIISGAIGLLDKIAYGWGELAALAKGTWEDGPNAGLRALADYQIAHERAQAKIESDAAKRKAQRGKGGAAGDGTDEKKEAVTADKAADAERSMDERRAKEVDKVKSIHEQIAEIQRKAAEAGMTATEKRAALETQIAELKSQVDPYGEATDLEIANRQKTIADRESDLATMDAKKTKATPLEVNAMQKIGGFIGTYGTGLEAAHLDVAKKSETHLAAIRQGINRIGGSLGGSNDGEALPEF